MSSDVVADGIENILVAVVAMVVLAFLFPFILGFYGVIMPCSGCESLTGSFVIGVLPIAAVFICLYFIWKRFSK